MNLLVDLFVNVLAPIFIIVTVIDVIYIIGRWLKRRIG
jgi:hypothetical protein